MKDPKEHPGISDNEPPQVVSLIEVLMRLGIVVMLGAIAMLVLGIVLTFIALVAS